MVTELINYRASNRTDAQCGEIETSPVMYLYSKKLRSEWTVDKKNEQLAACKFIGMGGVFPINWNIQEDFASSGISGIPS